MITCTKVIKIDAGHRLLKHESKCKNVHGHEYKFEITAAVADEKYLDEVGRVIDFSRIKELVGTWLDEKWDHGFIFQEGDPIGPWLKENDMKHFQVPFPPTAENLASFLLHMANVLLQADGIKVTSVICHETSSCRAEATL